MSETATLQTKGLDQLLKALKKSQPPVARVGILGDKTNRGELKNSKGSHQPTNAEVGAAHEFGAPARGIPQRSFLRTPISDKLQQRMESSGALDKQVLAEVIRDGSVLPWMKKIAVLAEGIVADAFASAGFGKWKSWKDPNHKSNANQILVDTGQLRNSITSEVKE